MNNENQYECLLEIKRNCYGEKCRGANSKIKYEQCPYKSSKGCRINYPYLWNLHERNKDHEEV